MLCKWHRFRGSNSICVRSYLPHPILISIFLRCSNMSAFGETPFSCRELIVASTLNEPLRIGSRRDKETTNQGDKCNGYGNHTRDAVRIRS